MKAFMNGLPLWLKVVFALPCLDIVWVVYRLIISLERGRTLGIVLAIILIVVGLPWLWLVDIICLLLNGKVWWID